MKVVKLVTPVIIAILLLAVSCTGPAGKPPQEIPSPSPEPAPTLPPAPPPEHKPPPVPTSEPEPIPVAPESKDTTIEFVWTVDPGVRLEDATVPYIHRLEDGRFRMYYGGPGGILSAISEDGMTFTKEPGVRVSAGQSG